MKRLLIALSVVFFSPMLHAQPWMQGRGDQPVKLQDVIDEYKKNPTAVEADDDEAEERAITTAGGLYEKKDYHFDRWVWYMKQHTDTNGYLVSPLKTFEEWNAYVAKQRLLHAAAKGTGGVTSNWTFIGPSGPATGNNSGVGRVNLVAFDPIDSNTFWVASGGGGAWKTTNNGVTWTCMTDALPVLGVSDIVFNPLNRQVIYLCTGDRDAGDSHSVGVLKSTDGGNTWNLTGLVWTVSQIRYANSLVMNPRDTSALMLASSQGIYKTNNGGTTWTLEQGGDFKQIVYRPSDSTVAYATGTVGNSSWGIYRTQDAGLTWTAAINVPYTSRIAVAVCPVAPNSVKAVVSNTTYGLDGIYSSSDTGKTFTKIFNGTPCSNNILNSASVPTASTCDGQGWYDLAIARSPIDSNKLLVGGVNTWQSLNGGTSWQIINQAYGGAPGVQTVHPDKHFLGYNPISPSILYEGNDGGIYKTAALSSTVWNDISNGLGITQFYRNAVSNSASFVLGGAQDNGSKKVTAATATQTTGGDGMNCEIDYSNPSVYYCASQYGSISRTTNGASFQNISNNIAGQPQGDWVTPYLLHPSVPTTLYAGYDKVYRTDNRGTSWTAISPSLNAGSNIIRLATCIADTATLYAVIANHIRPTFNSGASWDYIAIPYGSTISDIIAPTKDKSHILITFSGYGNQKVAEYDSVNGWRDISTGLPNIPVNCIAVDTANGTRYVGTDAAVFYQDSLGVWQLYSTGLPAAEIRDLGINYATDEIWAATYGRGMWKSAKRDPPPVAPNGISTIPLAMNVITVAPNPVVDGQFTINTSNSSLISRSADVHLIDISGRSVWHGTLAFNVSGQMEVATGSLAHGTYVVQVTGVSGVMARTKIVVM